MWIEAGLRRTGVSAPHGSGHPCPSSIIFYLLSFIFFLFSLFSFSSRFPVASFLPAFSSPPVSVVSAVASEVAEPDAALLVEACGPEDARSVEALAVRQVRSGAAQDD